MFIRLKTAESNDINVNAANILTFAPQAKTDEHPNPSGTVITFVGGQAVLVEDSTRSIRGYIKKAAAGQSENSEAEG